MKALKANGVSRNYGKQMVLQDFSLEIESGGFESLMGPSGSGKSTFLHIAAGLLAADAGSVEIGGKDVVRMSDSEATKFRRRHVGVVFQAFNLLNEKTVRDNILLPILLDGKSPVSRLKSSHLTDLTEKLGIADLLDKLPEELSGGEQQRVAVARALSCKPDILLADEPTGNLDSKSGDALMELLRFSHRFFEQTILLVTHNLEIARTAERIITLADGEIVSDVNGAGL